MLIKITKRLFADCWIIEEIKNRINLCYNSGNKRKVKNIVIATLIIKMKWACMTMNK